MRRERRNTGWGANVRIVLFAETNTKNALRRKREMNTCKELVIHKCAVLHPTVHVHPDTDDVRRQDETLRVE